MILKVRKDFLVFKQRDFIAKGFTVVDFRTLEAIDWHLNIWLTLLLSLLSQDIILGPGVRHCWYQPTHGAYVHLVTEHFSRRFRNCGNSLPA